MSINLAKLETFNRATESKYKAASPALRLDEAGHRIRLNMAAVEVLKLTGLHQDMKAQFYRLEKDWYLALTNNGAGYNILTETKARAGANINASVVMHQMLRGRKVHEYYLQETEHEVGGFRLYELVPKAG